MRPDFLTGAIDMHIHSGPDVIDRIGTSIDIARAAADTGMRAVVFKDHLFPSVVKAHLTEQAVPGIKVFGGITLNASVGGLNVQMVKASIASGAKFVMFPTFDSRRAFNVPKKGKLHLEHAFGEPFRLVPTIEEDGQLVPDAEAILRVLAEHPDVILSSGHLGPEEALPVVKRAVQLGITRIVIEHPNHGWYISKEQTLELAQLGATIYVSFNAYHPIIGKHDPAEAVALIRAVGAEHCALMTDGGQPYSPMPCETMRMFCEMLYSLGLSLDEISTVSKIVPARLLGLND